VIQVLAECTCSAPVECRCSRGRENSAQPNSQEFSYPSGLLGRNTSAGPCSVAGPSFPTFPIQCSRGKRSFYYYRNPQKNGCSLPCAGQPLSFFQGGEHLACANEKISREDKKV